MFRTIRYSNPRRPNGAYLAGPAWRPPVDVLAAEKEYKLSIDLPGVAESDVQVIFEESVLRVSGRRAGIPEDAAASMQERPSGEFERSFRFSDPVDADRIEARFDRGVLEIRVPKLDRSRRIEIQ